MSPSSALSSKNHTVGLTQAQVIERRQEFGENVLPAEKPVSKWTMLINQLKSPLVYIIFAAALVSLMVREYGDFVIIMVVVVVDAILGFVQEYQAQNTYLALKSLLKPTTTVLRQTERGTERVEIEVSQLVPGDLVVLSAGEKIPADGVVLEGAKLAVDEAILTGESEPISKVAGDSESPSASSTLFMGTTLLTGHGILEVIRTGSQTELGQIAASLHENIESETPLQIRLKAFSKSLTIIVVGFTLSILIIGIAIGRGFLSMLRTSIILAIAAVPEGLLIAVTVILVLGMRKILKRNGLVKRMLAVETLGSVTTICTDKTGTLTEGRMRVNHTDFDDPERAIETMVFCNNLEGPVDVALWEYARSQLLDGTQDLFDSSERFEEELFSSETKYMITGNLLSGSGKFNFLKGAPEIVLEMCSTEPAQKTRILSLVNEWAGEGLRLIGMAFRPWGPIEDHHGYTWVGLVGMEDPIREGVVEAVKVAQHAGIHVSMITGDFRRTAERIGRNIGLFVNGDRVLDGEEIARMDDSQLQNIAADTAVFARIRPTDKLRIIQALQSCNHVAAMIGDGVNDAPALKRADIGVVVGSAADVAKETADLVLLDNNFRTVVAAVEEGRTIFQNIRKVVAYTLSNSFAEVITIFTAMLLGWPTPLAVAQILWIHLICDGPSDIVLGFEPKEKGIMDEPPMSKDAPILTPLGLSLIGVISTASSIFALLIFHHYFSIHGSAIEGRSIVFASFAINSMVYIFAYRSMRKPLWEMTALKENPFLIMTIVAGIATALIAFWIPGLRRLLGIMPLSWAQWGVVAGIGLTLMSIVEIAKLIANGLESRRVQPTAH